MATGFFAVHSAAQPVQAEAVRASVMSAIETAKTCPWHPVNGAKLGDILRSLAPASDTAFIQKAQSEAAKTVIPLPGPIIGGAQIIVIVPAHCVVLQERFGPNGTEIAGLISFEPPARAKVMFEQ